MKFLRCLTVFLMTVSFLTTSLTIEARAGSGYRGGSIRPGSFSTPRSGGFYGGSNPNYQRYRSPAYPGGYGYGRSPASTYQNRSFWQNHPIMTGILAGLAGSWLGNMFFNSNTATKTQDPVKTNQGDFATWFGSKLPLIILIVVAYLIFRRYRRGPQNLYRGGDSLTSQRDATFGSGYSTRRDSQVQLSDQDYQQFAQLLIEVQNAWSENDSGRLRQLTSPDLFNYFSQILNENKSEGVRNRIENVQVINQELQDAWQEQNDEYVSVRITWMAKDYFVRESRNPNDADYITTGDPHNFVSNTEVWTFSRSPGRGSWILTGVQQD